MGGGGRFVAFVNFCRANTPLGGALQQEAPRIPDRGVTGSAKGSRTLGHDCHSPGFALTWACFPPLVGCEISQRAIHSRRLYFLTSDSPCGLYSLGFYLFEVMGDFHCCCYKNYPCEIQEKKIHQQKMNERIKEISLITFAMPPSTLAPLPHGSPMASPFIGSQKAALSCCVPPSLLPPLSLPHVHCSWFW